MAPEPESQALMVLGVGVGRKLKMSKPYLPPPHPNS